jgi:hypothetical protein
MVTIINRNLLNNTINNTDNNAINNTDTNTDNNAINNTINNSINNDLSNASPNKRKVIRTLRAGGRRAARSSSSVLGYDLNSSANSSENNENEVLSPPNWKAIGSRNNSEFLPPKNIFSPHHSVQFNKSKNNNNNEFIDFDIQMSKLKEVELKKSLLISSSTTELDEPLDAFSAIENVGSLGNDIVEIADNIAPLIKEKLWDLVSKDKSSIKNIINSTLETNDLNSSIELKRLINAYPTLPLNDLVDKDEWTLLMRASESGKIEVVKVLIANGCDATKKGNNLNIYLSNHSLISISISFIFTTRQA